MLSVLEETKPQGFKDHDWMELQARVAALIRLGLPDKVMYNVMDLLSLVEVWRKLTSQYISKSLKKKVVSKAKAVWAEDAGRYRFGTTH